MGGFNDLDPIDQAILEQLLLLRVGASAANEAADELEALADDIAQELSRFQEVKQSNKAAVALLLSLIGQRIAVRFQTIGRAVDAKAIAEIVAQATARRLGVDASAPAASGLGNAATPLVHGALATDWIERQADDVAFKVSAALNAGAAQAKNNAELAAEIRVGVIASAARNAATLVSAEVLSVGNAARVEVMRGADGGSIGMQQISVLDGRTSNICRRYAGATWDLDGNPINGNTLPFAGGTPRHWGCRSVIVPLLDAGGPARAPGAFDFEAWVDRLPTTVVSDVFGDGRVLLWKRGVITLAQLLDMRNAPLTVQELRSILQS